MGEERYVWPWTHRMTIQDSYEDKTLTEGWKEDSTIHSRDSVQLTIIESEDNKLGQNGEGVESSDK